MNFNKVINYWGNGGLWPLASPEIGCLCSHLRVGKLDAELKEALGQLIEGIWGGECPPSGIKLGFVFS